MQTVNLNPSSHQLLLFICSLLILPHIGTLQTLFIVIGFCLLGWSFLTLYFKQLSPSKWLLLPLSLGLAFLVFKFHGMSLGREASSSFLLVLMGLKLLECRQKRDVTAVIFLCFFVLITPFLFEQTIPLTIYSFLIFFLLLTMMVVNSSQEKSLKTTYIYRFSAIILLMSIPLMLIGFILFPRMIGPLWAMPSDSNTAVSGISNSINPGNISKLVLSKQQAFSVQFNGQSPAYAQLYWRGPVFWNTDGRQWTLSPPKKLINTANLPPATATYSYQLMMQPTQQHWVYSLDTPRSAPSSLILSQDYQLISPKKISRTQAFKITSSLNPVTEPLLSPEARQRALALPATTDDRIFKLAKQWQHNNPSSIDVISQGLSYFNQQNFYYTLTPPSLGQDPVSEFLFDTRKGFCGHYATSFAVVLRATGIPSRLVAGYLGGRYNEVGGFWDIRQSDAHVWVEAWVDNIGWMRVDPTASIAPERIQFSLDNDQQLGDEIKFLMDSPTGVSLWLRQLESLALTIDYYWQSGVLAYGPEVQNQFLSIVGINGWEDMMLTLSILAALILVSVTLYIYRTSRLKLDPCQRVYLRFCRRLKRHFFEKHPGETSKHYFERIIEVDPTLSKPLSAVRQSYLNCRYAKADIQPLITAIKAFKR